MKKIILLIAIVAFISSMNVQAAEKESATKNTTTTTIVENANVINGAVYDKQTAETLAGAVVTLDGQKVYTDLDGHFRLSNVKGKCQLKISMISYEDQVINIDPQNMSDINIELKQL